MGEQGEGRKRGRGMTDSPLFTLLEHSKETAVHVRLMSHATNTEPHACNLSALLVPLSTLKSKFRITALHDCLMPHA